MARPSATKTDQCPKGHAFPASTLIGAAAIVAVALVVSGCAAGDPRFTADDPAGFWVGVWHGMISWITLIIGIFADNVGVYEVDNTGGWYDFGFLLGIGALWGSSHARRRPAIRTRDAAEWERLGHDFERKLALKLREWAEAEPEEDWDAVVDHAETKLKRKIRSWAEEASECPPTAP